MRHSRMRICFAVETYPSVTETFVYEPVDWLERAGHRVAVVAAVREELPSGDGVGLVSCTLDPRARRGVFALALLKQPWNTASTVVRLLRIRRRRRFWFSFVVAGALLEEVRLADVVVAHFGPTGQVWLPIAFLARRRFAVYFHGYDVGAVLHRDPDAYADLFASGAALLTNSEYLKNRLVDAGASEERVAVVRLGVHPELAGTSSRQVTVGALDHRPPGPQERDRGLDPCLRRRAPASGA
jgi:colanic acid/amylovoran biosynthesis glycosyltransferase